MTDALAAAHRLLKIEQTVMPAPPPGILQDAFVVAGELSASQAALNAYRYAIGWLAADSWDCCSDCRSRLAWARTLDGAELTPDEMAAIGKQYLTNEDHT